MSATIDELLARADRLREREMPTRAQVMRELEEALEALEARPRESLGYATASLRVTSLKIKLEYGDFAEEASPSLTLLPGGRDDA